MQITHMYKVGKRITFNEVDFLINKQNYKLNNINILTPFMLFQIKESEPF